MAKTMTQLTPAQLQEWITTGKEHLLLDVREPWEHEAYNIGGMLLPMGSLMQGVDSLPREIPLVLYCEKGIRSVIAAQRLEQVGFEQLWNLSGGMSAWRAAGL